MHKRFSFDIFDTCRFQFGTIELNFAIWTEICQWNGNSLRSMSGPLDRSKEASQRAGSTGFRLTTVIYSLDSILSHDGIIITATYSPRHPSYWGLVLMVATLHTSIVNNCDHIQWITRCVGGEFENHNPTSAFRTSKSSTPPKPPASRDCVRSCADITVLAS